MKCPNCGDMLRVINSRSPHADVQITRRRRECDGCGKRYTTQEAIVNSEPKQRRREYRPDRHVRAAIRQTELTLVSMRALQRTLDDGSEP